MRFKLQFSTLARLVVILLLVAIEGSSLLPCWAHAASRGLLKLTVVDAETGQPIAARMHLRRASGKSIRPPKVPYWHDHFAVDGSITFSLRTGSYQFELERGLEYKTQNGHFEIQDFADDQKVIQMHRFVSMRRQGWWSGDLYVHRKVKDIELLMRADDLHVVPVVVWRNIQGKYRSTKKQPMSSVRFDEHRLFSTRAGEDQREGGTLLFFNLEQPLNLREATNTQPSSMQYLRQARTQPGVHVDAEKPFWWDMPVWLASGMVDSIGLANNHQLRHGVLDSEAWGKPRDAGEYPSPHGNSLWSETIYYHALNCGLRIPPSAGSDSGVSPNPIGYNRVYVHCGSELSYADWWENLRAGRVVITNGPLLLPSVEGQMPGHVFRADAGDPLELNIGLTLWTRDRIDYLEVIKNGQTEHEIRLDEWARSGGKLPPLRFQRSGWFLIRAVANNPHTYRFGSTGPYYVEIGDQQRISRRSAQFFLDWTDQRLKQFAHRDAPPRPDVQREYREARPFWQRLVDQATTQ